MPSLWNPISGAPVEGQGSVYNPSFVPATSNFAGYNVANYAGLGGGTYNSLSAYYGYGYNSYISGVAGTSPFFANFLASTGYSGGDTSLSSPDYGGYNSRGDFSGFPSILDFEAALPEALAPLLFNPNMGFSTPFNYGSSGVNPFAPISGGIGGIVILPALPSIVGGLPVPSIMRGGVGNAPGYEFMGGYDLGSGFNFARGSVAENIPVPEWLNRGVYELGPETWFPPGTANVGQMDSIAPLNPIGPPTEYGHYRTDAIGVWRGKSPEQRNWEDNGNNLNEWDYFY